MDSVLRYARAKQNDIIALIRELVECETPSGDAAAVNRFADLFAERVRDIAEAWFTLPESERDRYRAEFGK